jgi:aminoglycoside 6'-N-acetyltransferase
MGAQTSGGVTLRPARLDDLAILQHWDEQPHVVASDPNDDWGWEEQLRRSLDWRESLIAEVDGRPIGFLEIIDPARDDEHYWGGVPHGLRAIDIWIGEEADLSRGYGTQMMRLALARCFADPTVTAVLLDPLAGNVRAHRFYERLGFAFVEARRFGADDCFVYRLERSGYEAQPGAQPAQRADMYSRDWFDTFAATVPEDLVAADVEGIVAALPLDRFPRLLDVGCGIGRLAAPLLARGYAVTGLDVSLDALRAARQRMPALCAVALDQCHIGRLRWRFDAALVMWNSLGFAGRAGDRDTLAGLAAAIRPGGRLVLDLYHPEWMRQNEQTDRRDARGAVIQRWVRNDRCFHLIRYPSGRVDDIQFDLYAPDDMRALCRDAGFSTTAEMTRWDATRPASADQPRYQLVCERSQ